MLTVVVFSGVLSTFASFMFFIVYRSIVYTPQYPDYTIQMPKNRVEHKFRRPIKFNDGQYFCGDCYGNTFSTSHNSRSTCKNSPTRCWLCESDGVDFIFFCDCCPSYDRSVPMGYFISLEEAESIVAIDSVHKE